MQLESTCSQLARSQSQFQDNLAPFPFLVPVLFPALSPTKKK